MYAADVEVYPNFFCATFLNINDAFDIRTFVIFEDFDQSEGLKEFLSDAPTLIGYNILQYDNIILAAVIAGFSLEEIYVISQSIISGNDRERINSLRYGFKNPTIDPMKIMAFDMMGVGLKQVGISLKFPKIQDLPIPFYENVDASQVQTILAYNLNDVMITQQLYWAVKKEIDLRERVGELFDVNLANASRSRMANILLEKIYSRETGQSPDRFKELRTPREVVQLKRCIGKNIEFISGTMNVALSELRAMTLISAHKFRFKRPIHYAGKIFDVGVGGLHSRDEPNIFESKDGYMIIDADVDSFYPNIMLINAIKPKHLDNIFLTILDRLTKDRLEAKANDDYIKSDALKITINSIFGKLGSEVFWLYDPQAFFSVTISGQLYLLMMVEHFHLAGFEILSANTDGVTCRIRENELGKYYKICADWMNITGFTLSYAQYKRYIRRDVNNYLAEEIDPETNEVVKIKTKGLFDIDPGIGKSFKHPIIPKALHRYFLEGIPIEETIHESQDIHDFIWTQKVNKKFKVVFRKNGGEEEVQQTNRFYACVYGGHLVKVQDGKELSITTALIQIANNIDAVKTIESYKIDYSYYINEAQKWVNTIEPSMTSIEWF